MYNPLISSIFITSFWESDSLGKMIFFSLFLLSLFSWALMIYKYQLIKSVQQSNSCFMQKYQKQLQQPLEFDVQPNSQDLCQNLYKQVKQLTVNLLHKNHGSSNHDSHHYLSPSDINLVESRSFPIIENLMAELNDDLYLLSTFVTLSPFLGLLGTVWGILLSFSQMSHGSALSSGVLNGLSMALTTTVLGLICAIPALIGYNYLRNRICQTENQLNDFLNIMLTHIEIQYRKVDV